MGASYDNFSISNKSDGRTTNTSEDRVSDQSSRIIFGVAEDLGGGLKAIGQYDMRFSLDGAYRAQTEAATSPTPNFAAGGNSHVGLTSNDLGTVRFGRQDIYYVDQPSLLPGGLYLAANTQPVFHALANANASRTPNLLWWVSPRWNGFEATVAYSTNPLRASNTNEAESDLGTVAQRKGAGTVLRLNYTSGPIDATFVTMDYKSDYMGATTNSGTVFANNSATINTGSAGATVNGNADQKGNTLVLKYQATSALRLAAGFSDEKSILNTATVSSGGTLYTGTAATATTATAYDDYRGYSPVQAAGGTKAARATSFSASYDMGNWNFAMHQANRGNYKYDGVEAASTGASITSLAATYNFSKRTAAGLMMTTLKNDARNVTGLFYQGNNAYGGQQANLAGETQNITSLALRHNF